MSKGEKYDFKPINNNKKKVYYTGFSYLLIPDEIYLLMRISEFEYLVRYHTYSFRTKQAFLDKTNMKEDTFNEDVNNLHYTYLTLKTPEDVKGTIYRRNIFGYNNLVDTCGTTWNYKALKEYLSGLPLWRDEISLSRLIG